MSFACVDDAQLGAGAFRSYLRNYQNQFQVLGTIDLIFLTTSMDRFAIGQKALARFGARTIELPRGELSAPSENGVRPGKTRYLRQRLPAEALTNLGERGPFRIG